MIRSAAVLGVAGLLAAPAAALDLTGTWVGKFTCSVFDGVSERFPEPAQTLQISQANGDVRVLWVGVSTLTGVAIADAGAPETKGEVALADCATARDLFTSYAELVRLGAKVDRERGKGSLKGLSIYAPSGLVAGSCKWSFELEDPADPLVQGCP